MTAGPDAVCHAAAGIAALATSVWLWQPPLHAQRSFPGADAASGDETLALSGWQRAFANPIRLFGLPAAGV